MKPIDQNHLRKRTALRAGGLTLLAIGGLFMIAGLVDTFSAIGSMRPPRLFWCFFAAIPLLFVGAVMAQFGFLGAVGRYVAGEGAPVAKDTFNYVAEETQEGVQNVAHAVGKGLRAGRALADPSPAPAPCPKCGRANAADARFCDRCGQAIA